MSDEGRERKHPYTRPITAVDLQMALTKNVSPIKVFVAGPYIEKTWSAEQRAAQPAAAILRITLIEEIEAMQHVVVIGEHRGVLEVGDARLRSRSSPLVTEIALAREADAIVVIPSSPGSFSELGSWVMKEELCRKMLILADVAYKDRPGYVNLGVYKTAMDQSAKLIWIDYGDGKAALAEVSAHLDNIEDAVLARSIMNG
jgi:hypothetical protein